MDSFVFKKYFSELDGYTGDFNGLKRVMETGYEKMKADAK